MEELLKQLDVIRRWRYLVLAVTLIAAASALFLSLGTESTYTARATMFVGSADQAGDRSPEQDAVLTRAYAEDLNTGATQAPLRTKAGVPDDVSIEAVPVASSPIFYIEATAPNGEEAIRSAREFAVAYETSVAATFASQYEKRVEPVRALLRDNAADTAVVRQQLNNASGISAARQVELQGQLETLQAERQSLLNQLREVRGGASNPNLVTVFQPPETASENSPNLLSNLVLGIIGGLILGGVVALVLGSLQSRISSPETVRAKLGLPTLATVATGDPRRRAEDLRALSNGIALMAGEPRTLAITSATPNEGKSMVASNLARNRASLGDRVILVDANLRDHSGDGGNGRIGGLSGLLANGVDSRVEDELIDSGLPNMRILPAGPPPGDPYSLMSEERLRRVLERVTPLADLVVVDTPSLLAAAESQVVCSIADQTILVVDAANTDSTAAVEARDVLTRIHAGVLGVVLTRVPKRRG